LALTIEIKHQRWRFAPFHRIVNVLNAGSDGFSWILEARLFGYVLQRINYIRCAWHEIKKVQLVHYPAVTRFRIVPKAADRFAGPITGSYGGGSVRLPTGEDGGVPVLTGELARKLFEACKARVPGEEITELRDPPKVDLFVRPDTP
jgi:hypothetical protein